MLRFIKHFIGNKNSRVLKRYFLITEKINKVEESLQALRDSEIKGKTEEFRKRLQGGEKLDDLLVEAYAVVKNTCRRLCGSKINVSGFEESWNMIPYDVQIVGAIALHHNHISEMGTGEGKTLTAVMPLYLNALTKKSVHVVTVNDYLAKRDSEWMGHIFNWLEMDVSYLSSNTPLSKRRELYKSDILYGTASEFGFDYLRDNSTSTRKEDQVQNGYYYALIDEVDSILIDESRTPLIISGPVDESINMYDSLKGSVEAMVELQKKECTRLSSEARSILKDMDLLQQSEELPKLDKDGEKRLKEALKKLWLVSQGMPKNKILKKIKQYPDIRAKLDQMETYYWNDVNKEEKYEALSALHIIIDERNNDYELTDKGLQSWKGKKEEFIMLDLGAEYGKIDATVSLTKHEKLERKMQVHKEDFIRKERAHNIRQLFRAYLLLERDVDYVVHGDSVIIVDENTGRPQPGRRFSDGLHQAIEAKESVKIRGETQTYATITLQNYFRMYHSLAGMTGTAITESQEFKEIYKLDVVCVPTHKKCIRKDLDDLIFMTEREKYNSIISNIKNVHKSGRPILIGTASVEVSEKISSMLTNASLSHTILNAKNHAKEAEIISKAGEKNAITVSTNMAGRGTDIKLGEGVSASGGLHVIGSSRHQSRRIDRQLTGRAGRQGDPGSSRFYVSFEDSLLRLFAGNRLTTVLQRFRPPEGEPISASLLNKSIENAQRKVEGRNYTMRKHTLEYDNVIERQRSEVYAFRQSIMDSKQPLPKIYDIVERLALRAHKPFVDFYESDGMYDPEAYRKKLLEIFPINMPKLKNLTIEEVETVAIKKVIDELKGKLREEAKIISVVQEIRNKAIDPLSVLYDFIRSIMIQQIDKNWKNHLLLIDHLKTEVSLYGVAQHEPLVEFKSKSFSLFERFSEQLELDIAFVLFSFTTMPVDSPQIKKALSQAEILGPKKELTKALENAQLS